jgi:aminoglycoside/choline kinase family phosphotransferase
VKKEAIKLNQELQKQLSKLFYNYCGKHPDSVNPLPHSGSERVYFRLKSSGKQVIGAYNPDNRENETFLYMTRFFLRENLPVPEIYLTDLDNNIYLIEDLGDNTLFSEIAGNSNTKTIVAWLRKVVQELVRFQIVAGKKFDFSKCYPYKEFDPPAINYDLEYFRDQFLDRIGMEYSNNALQQDFEKLAEFIGSENKEFFMYRDFQSRNIMIHDNRLFFIDYQGGRKGPLQYDLASLLFQARARIPEHIKEEILDYYVSIARMLTPLSKEEFIRYYYAIAFIRVLQTLGAYGLRGLRERKKHFIESIPYALDNLKQLSEKLSILDELSELNKIIQKLKTLKQIDHGSTW